MHFGIFQSIYRASLESLICCLRVRIHFSRLRVDGSLSLQNIKKPSIFCIDFITSNATNSGGEGLMMSQFHACQSLLSLVLIFHHVLMSVNSHEEKLYAEFGVHIFIISGYFLRIF